MLLGKSRCYPNNGDRLKPCGIGQELPEVSMVGSLKLVLDQHPVPRTYILAKDVRSKGAHVPLLALQFELNIYGFR